MKKNIVLILSDQHNPKVMGCAGDPWIRTRNIDAVAEQGVSFTNTYCASPLCVPSRAALLSTRLPTETGIYTNLNALSSDEATFVHALSNKGYDTTLIGRMHFNGPDQRHGFRRRLVGDITTNQIGGPPLGFPDGFMPMAGQVLEGVQNSGAGSSTVIKFDEEVISSSEKFIKEYCAEEPFFLTIGLYGPHCPYVCPKELFDYYYNLVDLPEFPETFRDEVHPAIQKWYKNRGVDKLKREDMRSARAAYYGLVELTDQYVGRVLNALGEKGIKDDTLFIYTSDHGDMMGENGLFWKSNFYEGSVRVPLIMDGLGEDYVSGKIDTPVSLMDLGTTLLSLTDSSPLPETNGEDLSPLLKGGKSRKTDSIISICADLKGDAPSAMIRNGSWKLVLHHGYDTCQLFHLEDDPMEQNDLGADEEYHSIINKLKDELKVYFNSEDVSDAIRLSKQHTNIIGQWTKQVQPKALEQWVGKKGDNYIE